MSDKTDLTIIPGIGNKLAKYLVNLGYKSISSLKGQNPEEMYMKHCLSQGVGNNSCKCVLYCFRLAVCYADNDGVLPPDKQRFGDWKD